MPLEENLASTVAIAIDRIADDGSVIAGMRPIAVECPVAIEFNGIGYAVMMATPDQLEAFAVGFALGERLIERWEDIVDVDLHEHIAGWIVRVTLAPDRLPRLHERVRHRISDSSCGLCGIENLEQALRPLPRVASRSDAGPAAIFLALAALRDSQPLNQRTGAVHAAALCGSDGAIRTVREDVGRHNAFDKLIGAMAMDGLGWDGGFALLSSRCSYELVEKAALADCPMLVTISAATDLAVRRASEAGLKLVMLARSDAMLAVAPAP
ncbi:formate dehydrogenase accessory sulfurtransferase FdhD [Sphingomonas japonica]|uniref:Sulfur carrier protein FdhD n=1 Tax=Sphingomonas japonica TaxID=511662 RepID=A0ABX0U1P7_9SPHN|nr:FdhD protein [Sphingomonas japonica]